MFSRRFSVRYLNAVAGVQFREVLICNATHDVHTTQR